MASAFYLGTHRPNWIGKAPISWFVSWRTLHKRKTFPRATAPWFVDSGGFTEVSKNGRWTITPETYVADVRRLEQEVGMLGWAAPQDWMCEPHILKKTGLTVLQHQINTINNYLELRWIAPDLPFIPVLQGWTHDDYMRHVAAYAAAGVDLTKEKVVGIGSVCRRQSTQMVEGLISDVAGLGIRLHGFGFKTLGLQNCDHLLASSDSMAWSFAARHQPPLPGHTTHKNCANCLEFALQWRTSLLERLASKADSPKQTHLNFYAEASNDTCSSAA